MCQVCVNNGILSQETYDKIERFLEAYPDAEFGPAHIVLSDDNVDDGSIRWCLGLAKAGLSKNPNDLTEDDDLEFMVKMEWYADNESDSLQATVTFLEELLRIPEDVR